MNKVSFDIDNSFSLLDYIEEFIKIVGNDFVVKGGFALHKMYNDSSPSSRMTMDLDLHVKLRDSWSNFKSVGSWKSDRLGVEFKLDLENKKSKSTPNGERVIVKIISNELEIGSFRVDMNYGDYCKQVVLDGINFYDYSMIIADKLSVTCSGKVRRRCKDLYDIYLVSSHIHCNMGELVTEIIKKVGDSYKFGKISLLQEELIRDIERAYGTLDIDNKPSFSQLSSKVLSFIIPLLSCIDCKDLDNKSVWSGSEWKGGKPGYSRILSDIDGTVCGSSASGLLGLSTFPKFPMSIARFSNAIDLGIIKFVTRKCDSILPIKGSDTLTVTDKFSTILDCIMYSEYRIASECVETFIEDGGSISDIRNSLDKEYHYILDDIIDGLQPTVLV